MGGKPRAKPGGDGELVIDRPFRNGEHDLVDVLRFAQASDEEREGAPLAERRQDLPRQTHGAEARLHDGDGPCSGPLICGVHAPLLTGSACSTSAGPPQPRHRARWHGAPRARPG